MKCGYKGYGYSFGREPSLTLIEKIQKVFPRATNIPETLLNDIPCIQTGYLVNGEIRVWEGLRQEVLSPVCVAGDTAPKPYFIGEYPLLTEAESFQALDAAVAAYNHGRGLWPTLSVAERIDHMERFVFRMIEEKDRIVRLIDPLVNQICRVNINSQCQRGPDTFLNLEIQWTFPEQSLSSRNG